MKCLILLGLLAVSSVWALPNAAEENEGEKLALNERSKRDLANVGGQAEGEKHMRKKRNVEASGDSSELDLDVDINIGGSRGKSDIDISLNVDSGLHDPVNTRIIRTRRRMKGNCAPSTRSL